MKALEMQNKADEKSYQKSGGQLKAMFLDENLEEAKEASESPSVLSAPPSPFMKPKRSSFKDMPVDEILKDFAVSPKPDPVKPKKGVHWAEGAAILDVRLMPKQYDPTTKKVCFYSDDDIKKFRFEKVGMNRDSRITNSINDHRQLNEWPISHILLPPILAWLQYLEDHEDEFEEVVDEGEYEWIEEEIIEIEDGFEFEEVVEYVYEDDAVSI